MKTTNTLPKIFALLLSGGLALISTGVSAQNLLNNPGFQNGSAGWSTGCSIEIYPENVYGGSSSSNYVTEIDVERCFNQEVAVSPGNIYDFGYKASRRQGSTPATVGMTVTITGVQSGVQYLNISKTYTNTTWAYTTESFSFTLPSNSIDTRVNITFSNYLTTGTYGTIIDDINFNVDPQSSVLPVKLISFSGDIKNNTAVLNWTATNEDKDGKYFIIERAAAQGAFDSIGVLAVTGTRYSFIDLKMLSGSNNYRLKMLSMAGYTYSKVIKMDAAIAASVQIYPNPATSSIGFKLTSTTKKVANVQIYSLSGSVVDLKQVQLNVGLNTGTLDITALHPGAFFLKISDGNGMNYAQQFCKK